MKSLTEKNNLLFTALQSLYWSSICLSATFLALYLESEGYTKEQTGILFAFGSFFLMMGQYFWGAVCHKYPWLGHKQILLFCMGAAILFNLFFPIHVGNFVIIVALYCVFNFTYYAMAPLIDAWTMARKLDSPDINYGLTRGFGSAIFAVVAGLFGIIFRHSPIVHMFLYSTMFIGLALAVAYLIRPARLTWENLDKPASGVSMTIQLLKNPKFLILLGSLIFVSTALNANFSFYGLLITQLGGSSYEFGIGIFLMAMSEFVVMLYFSRLLAKFSARTLLIYAFIFVMLKSACLAAAQNLQVAILAQLLQSVSFGLFLPACLTYIGQIVKKSELTLAIMLFATISWGVAGMTGNYLGGIVSQLYGISVMFGLNAVLATVGLVIFMITFLVSRHPQLDNEKNSML